MKSAIKTPRARSTKRRSRPILPIGCWCLTVVGIAVCLAACGTPQRQADSRAADRICEAVISQKLHEVSDVWAKRYAIIVWCASSNDTGALAQPPQGEITITVAPANGQEGIAPDELRIAEQQLRPVLEGVVRREGWEVKYPVRVLQAVP